MQTKEMKLSDFQSHAIPTLELPNGLVRVNDGLSNATGKTSVFAVVDAFLDGSISIKE